MIITILRKPLDGTVAENTLKHGCGALNIDATRVGNIVQDTSNNGRSPNSHKATVYLSGLKDYFEGKITTGRWPANFILTHKEGCELKGTKKIRGIKGGTGNHKGSVYGERSNVGSPVKDYANKDGKETVEDWDCVDSCPVRELDRQSGQVKGYSSQNHNNFNSYQGNSFHNSSTQRQGFKQGYDDIGTASRFFKQFKKEDR